jgi:membrane protease YdiL (CAAX protease family)
VRLERFRPGDGRVLALCALVSVVGAFVGVRYYFRAFPEASIDFRITKEASRAPAERFLGDAGLDPSGYRHAAVFGYDETAKTFLERELGVTETAALLDGPVRLWRWKHRWYRPLQKEELAVELTTRGEIVGFEHTVPEDVPGPDLAQEAARRIAERFLTGTLGRSLDDLEFVEGSSQRRPARGDHAFVWKLAGLEVRGGDVRIEVGVAGDRPARYREFLRVPEAWSRDYRSLRSRNELTNQVAAAFLLLTLGAMVVLLVGRIRRGDVRWRAAWILGGITFALLLVSQLNALPAALYDYDTTQSFGGFLALRLLLDLAVASGGGGALFLIGAAAEPLYRERFPGALSVTSLLRWRALRTREFFLNAAVGIALTFFFFAYENVFYLVAHAWGAWSPREVYYTDLLSTAVPWVFVLFFGWLPAVSEEFISRMFSIPFLERLGRSTVFAVVVSAFIWGFGHAGYPNQPFYIRGIEVGLAGVAFAWVFLRYGIVSVVICHFSVDALYAALALLRSPSLYHRVSGGLAAGVFLVFLIGAWVAYVRRGGFLPAEGTNAEEGVAPPVPLAAAAASAVPAPAASRLGRRAVGVALGAAAFFGMLRLAPVERFGDWVDFATNRAEARAEAERFLRGAGLDPAGHRSTVVALDRVDVDAAAYVRDQGGLAALNQLYGAELPTPLWSVRWFTPGDAEELRVTVDAVSGRALGFTRTLPEAAPGARLEADAAEAMARAFLAARGIDASRGERKERTLKDEPNRRDHTLVWEFEAPGIGAARVRHQVIVQGDRVGAWTRGLRVPEAWERERAEMTLATVALRWLKLPVLALLSALALYELVRRIRAGQIPWRPAAAAGGAGAILWTLHSVLQLDGVWDGYVTSVPAGLFAGGLVVGLGIGGVSIAGVLCLLCGLAVALHPAARGLLEAEHRRVSARDALVAGWVALGALVGLQAVSQALAGAVPSGRLVGSLRPPAAFEASIPGLDALCTAAVAALFLAALGGIVAALVRDHLRSPLVRVALVALGVAAFVSGAARTGPERLVSGASVATWAAVVAVAAMGFRGNALAWLWSPFFALAAWGAIRLLAAGDAFYGWNGAAVATVVVVLSVGLVRAARAAPARASGPPSGWSGEGRNESSLP